MRGFDWFKKISIMKAQKGHFKMGFSMEFNYFYKYSLIYAFRKYMRIIYFFFTNLDYWLRVIFQTWRRTQRFGHVFDIVLTPLNYEHVGLNIWIV